MEHFDVIIVGAGLSGIGAAARLKMECPNKTFAILEGRERMGGTWDLFRYPGVRSDSDMFTLGYRFSPWRDPKAIADAPAILNYIRDTSREFKLDDHVRYAHRVTRAEWSSETAAWILTTHAQARASARAISSADPPAQVGPPVNEGAAGDDLGQFTCSFLYLCTGYYDYDGGYTPEFKNSDKFRGTIVHPQKWPEDLEYENKRVVVIGSGATAVTLVPAMAETAAHVTMLQRSPTYVVTRPTQDKIANLLRRVLPAKSAYMLSRWKNVLFGMFFYALSRKKPETMKRILAKGVTKELGEEQNAKHFTPRYNPWDQRLCLVPDADLFRSIKEGRASVVTDEIDTFTENGLLLKSGEHLDADVVVTATGLVLKLMAGLRLAVDGEPVDFSKKIAYKGMMYSDVPNVASAFGYTNASWTLKCDLTAEYVCRLLKFMDRRGYAVCTPRLNDPTVRPEPVIDFTSTYVRRALPTLPKQGSKAPWRLHQNYVKDLFLLRYGSVQDAAMEFKPAPPASQGRRPNAQARA